MKSNYTYMTYVCTKRYTRRRNNKKINCRSDKTKEMHLKQQWKISCGPNFLIPNHRKSVESWTLFLFSLNHSLWLMRNEWLYQINATATYFLFFSFFLSVPGDLEIFAYFFGPIGILLFINLMLFASTTRQLTCGLWKLDDVKSTTER